MWPIFHGIYFGKINTNPLCGNNIPEILYFLLPKNTFRLFGTKMMITKKLQYKIKMLEMLSPGFTIDEDIIKEDQNEVSQVGPK